MLEEIKLSFKGKAGNSFNLFRVFVGKVDSIDSSNDFLILTLHGKDLDSDLKETLKITNDNSFDFNGIHSIKYLNHIKVGDIIIVTNSSLRSLFRVNTPNNSIFATIRCNSNCLMCSQPPLDYDDTEDNIKAWLYAIELMPKDVNQIGITGGEPTLLGEGLVLIVNKLQKKYPTIIIDILSNGRLQAKDGTIDILSKITNPSNVIFAIPLYSDIYKEHDYIVQAKDAFHQTCLGIHKMASVGFMIEIRVVLHKLSIKRLYNLSKFIHFNFPFSYHITFMGLEIIGYTKANKELLLIDDQDTYISKIKQSLEFLDKWKYKTSIYNTPFCQLPKNLWDYSRQSISDWKNSFHDECDSCVMKKDCAGFFSWNLKYSKVYPITSLDE